MSESDGIEEAFEGQLRMGLLVGGRVAEELARLRELAARRAEQESVQAARDLQDRLAAERAAARAALIPLERDAWWERAQPGDIGQAWQTARQWDSVEPDARRAAETIREQVQKRYGLDVDALQPRPDDTLVRALGERVAQARTEAERSARDGDQERAQAGQEVVVATLMAQESATVRADADASPAAVETASSAPEGSASAPVPAGEAAARIEAANEAALEAAAEREERARQSERAAAWSEGAVGQGRAEALRAATAAAAGASRGASHDTRARREETQARLTQKVGSGHAEAVEAVMAADTANARPVTAAVLERGPGRPEKSRRRVPFGRARGQAHSVER